MKNKMTLVFGLVLLMCVSCGKGDSAGSGVEVESQNANLTLGAEADQIQTETIKIQKSSRKIEWKQDYTRALAETLSDSSFSSLYTTEINEADLKRVNCKNFNQLTNFQKQTFYIVYMAAIAEAESDFRTHIKYETPGDGTINVGMLQIDEASATRHAKGAVGNVDENDLTNGETNLKVGVYILKNQLGSKVAKGRLFPERSYYWQVLTYTKPGKDRDRVLKNIAANASNISFCKN